MAILLRIIFVQYFNVELLIEFISFFEIEWSSVLVPKCICHIVLSILHIILIDFPFSPSHVEINLNDILGHLGRQTSYAYLSSLFSMKKDTTTPQGKDCLVT